MVVRASIRDSAQPFSFGNATPPLQTKLSAKSKFGVSHQIMALNLVKRRVKSSTDTSTCWKSTKSTFIPPLFRPVSSISSSEPKDPIHQSQEKSVQNLNPKNNSASSGHGTRSDEKSQKPKTIKELDDELRMKMAGLAGDGGEAGVEYEDGEPTPMKRSVRNNLFRVI